MLQKSNPQLILKTEVAHPIAQNIDSISTNAEQIVFDLLTDAMTGNRIYEHNLVKKAERLVQNIMLTNGLVDKALEFGQIKHYSDGINNCFFGFATLEKRNDLLFSGRINHHFPIIHTQTEDGERIERVTHLQFKNRRLVGSIIVNGTAFNLDGKTLTQYN